MESSPCAGGVCELPACLRCSRPLDATRRDYCLHCRAPVGEFTSNLPFEGVAASSDFLARWWTFRTDSAWRKALILIPFFVIPVVPLILVITFGARSIARLARRTARAVCGRCL